MSGVRWMVLRDSFPFAEPTDLGVVTAPDKGAAEELGREQFGGRVLVRSIMSIEAAKYERVAGKVTARTLSDVELDDADQPLTRAEQFRRALAHVGITADAWSLEARVNQSTVSKVARGVARSPKIAALIDRFIADVASGNYERPAHAKQPRSTTFNGRRRNLAIDISRAHELKRSFGCIVLLLFALVASSCSSAAAPACDPPHTWSVRTDLEHHPHSYFWCTCGLHEPRDRAEIDEANAWYARGGR